MKDFEFDVVINFLMLGMEVPIVVSLSSPALVALCVRYCGRHFI